VITCGDAGADASVSVCSGEPPFSLFDCVGGKPGCERFLGPGPAGRNGPQFDPATDPGGVYTYTVGAGSCTDAATVTITNVPGPDAGTDGTLQICQTSAPEQLINSLGGTPEAGGSWTGPGGPHNGTLILGRMPPGDYTYVVAGSPPCPDASATVTVVITGPDAGTDASLSVCSSQAAFPLIDALGGSPDAGGSWTGPGGQHGPQYDPAIDPDGVLYILGGGGLVHR
jgi:hypothetical protein